MGHCMRPIYCIYYSRSFLRIEGEAQGQAFPKKVALWRSLVLGIAKAKFAGRVELGIGWDMNERIVDDAL